MSIFGKIRDAIFGHRAARPHPEEPHTPNPAPGAAQPAPQQQQTVDVQHVLEAISREKGNPQLNYETSIVDLMKLLGLDSSLENRKELATELGYSGPKDGSAEMNLWLHKAVMNELAKSGGKVPASLAD